jgi:predicted anti-sigma-YlaC factor YlaD
VSDPHCERFRELASDFLDERLEGEELLAFEGHIEGCAGCRRFETGLRRFRQLLRAAAAVEPLRRPPAGFAAGVTARLARETAPVAVPFARPLPGRRPLRALAGLAAAAAAALFFAWSWQRLLPGEEPAQRVAERMAAPSPLRVAAAEEGSMDSWLRQHALLARDGTILGSAEEIEFTSFRATAPGR